MGCLAGLLQCGLRGLAGFLLCAVAFIPCKATAQSYETGGIQLRFSTEGRVTSQTNAALSPVASSAATVAQADFSYGITTQTRSQSFEFGSGISLRGAKESTPDGIVDPHVTLRYARLSRGASLELSAEYRETDLSTSGSARDVNDPAETLTGTATQQTSRVKAAIAWGLATPLSFGITAHAGRTHFRGGDATALGGLQLGDITEHRIGAQINLDLDPLTRLSQSVSFQRFDTSTSVGSRETFEADSQLRMQRPLGDLSFGVGYTRTVEGSRLRATIDRDVPLPFGSLGGGVGVSRSISGQTYMTGRVEYEEVTATRRFAARIAQDVQSSARTDAERLTTVLSILYQQEVTNRGAVTLRAQHGKSQDTATAITASLSAVEVSYAVAVTKDVTLDLGVRHRRLYDDITGSAKSNEVFISLRRVVLTRF